ncbi:class I SAM-dependent methyltransferase [Jeotgalibacillus sp. S-D1]|uniref:class I SAM-dependent methyltransferase n=1 Tax=Jeotgalibacillus sp. S-D1 TaxID=2552189 RepID=UPI0010599566|nr:class I SAM-dependent methyltransferase [Jeotgalibacillus sp. S-D1]TDL31496.1 class I SAM-dependent methyltransferase [Jeotgalibacillus sp. S-D1]
MKMPFFQQFSHPEGKMGKLAGFIMSKENKKLNNWAIGCMDLQTGDRVLEIGHGTGYSIHKMLKGDTKVYVDGVDASIAMTESASRRLKHHIKNGRARLMTGKAESLILPLNHYQKILSVNNFTLWDDPVLALENLFNSLKQGGRIVIMMQPREEEASPNLTKMMGNNLYRSLNEAGFSHVTISYRRIWPELSVCAVGFKKVQLTGID